MSIQKRPALRRNYSEERLPKNKDHSLPNLVKPQDLPPSPAKRYNLEPFKLRINNAQERRAEGAQEGAGRQGREEPQDKPIERPAVVFKSALLEK